MSKFKSYLKEAGIVVSLSEEEQLATIFKHLETFLANEKIISIPRVNMARGKLCFDAKVQGNDSRLFSFEIDMVKKH